MSSKYQRMCMWSAVAVFVTLLAYLLLRMYTPPAQKNFYRALDAMAASYPKVEPTASLDPNAIISMAAKLPVYQKMVSFGRDAAKRFTKKAATECFNPPANDIQAAANEQQLFLDAMLAARKKEFVTSRTNKYALATIGLTRAVFLNSQSLISPFTETYRRAQMQTLIKALFNGSEGRMLVTSNYTLLRIVHQCARALITPEHPEAMKLSPMMRSLLTPYAKRLDTMVLSVPKGDDLTIPDVIMPVDMLASCLAVQCVFDAAMADANPAQFRCQVPVPVVDGASRGLRN